MGGIKISNYQDVAGKRERSVSLYVIDSSFKGAGNNGPLPPTNCAANRKEADNMCSYKNLNVRAPRNATICISHEHRPFRHVYTGEGACWMSQRLHPQTRHLTDACCAVGAAG